MSESSFNIERATNGLVLALFLASALFLGVILYYVLRDMDQRAPSDAEPQAVVHPMPSPGQHAEPLMSSPIA
ncbi:hypothetical protein CRI94_11220 [Longibacter salinarum]|uniref:Uncharacterized protein n=1 Tax=Longibacter salinarum TaxID=1850348 RepID=A0A2A8CX90_9BACT|nr:hypothetical protein [Longibacter salinarum]PEN13204.1 hypothetical protein CRI94_11220 [Longibacter salinarum]